MRMTFSGFPSPQLCVSASPLSPCEVTKPCHLEQTEGGSSSRSLRHLACPQVFTSAAPLHPRALPRRVLGEMTSWARTQRCLHLHPKPSESAEPRRGSLKMAVGGGILCPGSTPLAGLSVRLGTCCPLQSPGHTGSSLRLPGPTSPPRRASSPRAH